MTDKLKDIREGDTVEITVRGTARTRPSGDFDFTVEGGHSLPTNFSPKDVASPHFSIKKVEKPLAVGDRVRFHSRVAPVLTKDGEIVALSKGCAWVILDNQEEPVTRYACDLERI